ncbi:MAG TPA: PIN domain-containing protein [Pseudonocardiaceae bacterium]|jgi:predicted nucleic acid-binding protein|nr:PIN domain-containing protein [Pseudonocardiaceae bacterium]
MIYLESSALVTLVAQRQNSKELRRFLDARSDRRTCTSTLGFVEAVRTCKRVGSFPDLMASLVADHAEVMLDNETWNAAATLPGKARSVDAIHVASAEVLGPELTAFVTYDNRVATAAHAAGLPVVMPGVDLSSGRTS